MSPDPLDEVIAEVARVLPPDQVDLLAGFIDAQGEPTDTVLAHLSQLVPTAGFATQATALARAWRDAPGAAGASLAMALRSTARAVDRARREERVQVVWTGPTSKAVPLRQTLGVLTQVIKAAQERLVVVSFAAYKVATVVDAMREASKRGVKITVVVDEATDAGKAFDALSGAAGLYRWPDAGSILPSGGIIRMHVKAAVADDHTALIGSANLTGQALSENMELGLLVEGGEVPRRLAQHFRELIAAEVLVPIDD